MNFLNLYFIHGCSIYFMFSYSIMAAILDLMQWLNLCCPHGQFIHLLFILLLQIFIGIPWFYSYFINCIMKFLFDYLLFLHLSLHVQLLLPLITWSLVTPGHCLTCSGESLDKRLTWVCWACSLSSGVGREEVWQLLRAIVMNPLPWAYRLSWKQSSKFNSLGFFRHSINEPLAEY